MEFNRTSNLVVRWRCPNRLWGSPEPESPRRTRFLGGMSVRFPIHFMLLACISGAFGQADSSFYVSTTGNDSNPGTQSAPWRTVQHASDTVRAGSTVNVRGGVYEELVTIRTSGNATDGYITFRSYPGETAI